MEFQTLVKLRRTIRFYENRKVPVRELMNLIEIARFAPSGSNKQPIRYIIIDNEDTAKKIFDVTRYGGAVTPRRNPVWGVNAPRSFIAVTSAKGGSVVDASCAIQNILLGAADNGLGCCWIGAFNKEEAKKILDLGEETELHFLIAVGYPAETPQSEDISSDQSTAYYLDDNNVLHVPKIKTEDITAIK